MVNNLGFDLSPRSMDMPQSPAKTAKPKGEASQSEVDFKALSTQSDTSTKPGQAQATPAVQGKKLVDEKAESSLSPEDTVDASKMGWREPVMAQPAPQATALPRKSEEVTEVVEAPATDAVATWLTPRKAVIAQFMKQMQDQLGVRPEKIVQAMANLTPEELMRSPEETMNLVLNQLNLSLKDRPKAEALYKNMLEETSRADSLEKAAMGNPTLAAAMANPQPLPQVSQTPQAPQTAQAKMQTLSAQQLRQQQMAANVEKLNKEFYRNQAPSTSLTAPSEMAQAPAMPTAMPTATPMASAIDEEGSELFQLADDSKKTPIAQLDSKRMPNTDSEFFGNQPASRTPSATTAALGGRGGSMATSTPPAAMTEASIAAKTQPIPQALANLISQGQPSPELSDQDMIVEDGDDTIDFESESPFKNAAPMATSGEPVEVRTRENRQETNHQDFARHNKNQNESAPALHNQAAVNESASQPSFQPASVAPRMETSHQDQAKNVQEIMSKAQVLVRQGGGEVKVQLNPEGLGQVNLKVAVHNGQVNIQMLTESNEAKHAVESSLNDLRHHLATNKLNLDSVKINVASDPNAGLQHHGQDQNRGQKEALQDMSREFARGFLSNFREERHERDANFSDLSRMRGYSGASAGKTTIDEPVAPAAKASSSSRKRNGRLSLLA